MQKIKFKVMVQIQIGNTNYEHSLGDIELEDNYVDTYIIQLDKKIRNIYYNSFTYLKPYIDYLSFSYPSLEYNGDFPDLSNFHNVVLEYINA